MNKEYHVYGIGNALVDLEFEVTHTFLKKHNVKKGVMTLVDEETQFDLINDINRREAVGKPGGSAANTIFTVRQFGGSSFYSCKVANDRFGDLYLNDMKEVGIDTNFDRQNREEGITGKCLVMITDDAERTMNTYLGTTATLSTREVDEEAVKNSKYVYIEGYLVAAQKGYDAMRLTKKMAQRHDVKTALTLSDPSVVEAFKDRFNEVIGPSVDLLFCNEEEAKIYTGRQELDEAREVLKKTAEHFVITRGEDGAIVFDGHAFIDIDPYDTEAIDTTGAGDIFAGAFLYGLTNGFGYESAGKLASLAGSKIVSQFGPRLQSEQVAEILKRSSEDS